MGSPVGSESVGARQLPPAELDATPTGTEDAFEGELTTLLVGIAVRRADRPEDVVPGRR